MQLHPLAAGRLAADPATGLWVQATSAAWANQAGAYGQDMNMGMEFKKKQVSADLEAQKDSARRKARHEVRQAAPNASSGSAFDQSWDEQLSFMAVGDDESDEEGDS